MEPLMSVKDAATFLALSVFTIRAYVASGKLNPVRIGRRVLIEQSEIRRFIECSRQRTMSPSDHVSNSREFTRE